VVRRTSDGNKREWSVQLKRGITIRVKGKGGQWLPEEHLPPSLPKGHCHYPGTNGKLHGKKKIIKVQGGPCVLGWEEKKNNTYELSRRTTSEAKKEKLKTNSTREVLRLRDKKGKGET